MPYTVGIAGITGKFATLVLRSLLALPSDAVVAVRGLARDPTKLPEELRSDARVHITQGSATDTSALAAFAAGCDVVICAYLGDDSLMVDGQKLLIDACEAAGVRRYIASDYSLDYTRLQLGELPPKDFAIRVREYLTTKKIEGVYILIGAFTEIVFANWFGNVDAVNAQVNYWGNGDELWDMTTYANAAEFVSHVAVDESAVGLQKFAGDVKNMKQLAQLVEKVYGKPVTLNHLGSLEDLRGKMEAARAAQPQNMYAWMAFYYIYSISTGVPSLSVAPGESKYTGLKPVTAEDFLRLNKPEGLATAFMNP